jgi:putative ABC transport system substrate-binding protein
VFTGGSDPVAIGLVKSLHRPGGNATGVTGIGHALAPKRLDILRQIVPNLATVAMLAASDNPSTQSDASELTDAARCVGLRSLVIKVATDRDLETAFRKVVDQKAGAMVIAGGPFFGNRRQMIATLAAHHRVPVIYGLRDYVTSGGLVSYGPSFVETHRLAGVYAGRIMKGERPADLPVIQASRFEFVINLGAAQALGLVIPPTLLALADEVIE